MKSNWPRILRGRIVRLTAASLLFAVVGSFLWLTYGPDEFRIGLFVFLLVTIAMEAFLKSAERFPAEWPRVPASRIMLMIAIFLVFSSLAVYLWVTFGFDKFSIGLIVFVVVMLIIEAILKSKGKM